LAHLHQAFGPLFGDVDVQHSLSAEAHVRAMLDIEVALVEAEADAGIVPRRVVAAIRQAADAESVDLAVLAREAVRAGNLAIPLVRWLTQQVALVDPEAAGYVHWGATSQDVIDTGFVLQIRRAGAIVLAQLAAAAEAAARHAREYASTPMVGRTWLQQAVPITFGLKAAGWLDALDRGHDRLAAALADASVLQFGGAGGTLAALGPQATSVAAALAVRLGLAEPDLPWHAQRDRPAALACALGIAVGTAGKIAKDLALLAQTEIGEAFEGPEPGRGVSSAMPQKRNPVRSAVALAAACRAPGLVATMLAALPQEHERGLGGWQAEWTTLPVLVDVAAGAARAVAEALEALEVDAGRMEANLGLSRGLVMAEAVSMALASGLGRSTAHALVEAACRRAMERERSLHDVLAEQPEVTRAIDPAHLAKLFAPAQYLGAAGAFVARVLDRHDRRPARSGDRRPATDDRPD
jgi:3-carboxy-cis,cis-muconate cycloisomerase